MERERRKRRAEEEARNEAKNAVNNTQGVSTTKHERGKEGERAACGMGPPYPTEAVTMGCMVR